MVSEFERLKEQIRVAKLKLSSSSSHHNKSSQENNVPGEKNKENVVLSPHIIVPDFSPSKIRADLEQRLAIEMQERNAAESRLSSLLEKTLSQVKDAEAQKQIMASKLKEAEDALSTGGIAPPSPNNDVKISTTTTNEAAAELLRVQLELAKTIKELDESVRARDDLLLAAAQEDSSNEDDSYHDDNSYEDSLDDGSSHRNSNVNIRDSDENSSKESVNKREESSEEDDESFLAFRKTVAALDISSASSSSSVSCDNNLKQQSNENDDTVTIDDNQKSLCLKAQELSIDYVLAFANNTSSTDTIKSELQAVRSKIQAYDTALYKYHNARN